MKLSDKISMAYRDIINRKFRSLLTIVAISVGALLLVAMLGLGDGISKQFDDMISNFGNANEINVMSMDMSGFSQSGVSIDMTGEETKTTEGETKESKKDIIDNKDLQKISKIKGVDYTLASISSNISATKIDNGAYIEKSDTVIGINLDYSKDFSDEVVEGKGLSGNSSEVLVTDKYLKKANINKEDIVGKTLTIKVEFPAIEGMEVKEPLEIQCTVVGVLGNKSYYTSGLVMSDKDVEKVMTYITGVQDYVKENGYSNLSVFVKDSANINAVCSKITKETGLMTMTLELMKSMMRIVTKVVKAILSIAGIIVTIVAALGLVNTMTMTLQEKRKMIGVMRSVGASRGKIRIVFIFQSLLLGLSGGALGSLLAALGIFVTNKLILTDSSFEIGFNSGNVILAMVITLVIALLAGLIPSGRAAKLNVVEAVAEE